MITHSLYFYLESSILFLEWTIKGKKWLFLALTLFWKE
jgi:hypothetical protein